MLNTHPNLLIAILLTLFAASSYAAEHPLFQSNESLELVFDMPLEELLRQARKRPSVTGVLQYADIDGRDIVLDVTVSTRGNSRLDHCKYPPLSIKLKRKQVESTLFAGQNKLKLVTLCRDSKSYRSYLNQEYAIYKLYNLLSEYSFRARMFEVVFRDSSGRRRDVAHPAFFIESDKEVAERLKMTTVNSNVVSVSQLDSRQLNILSVFQFMIGNTDWSVRKGPGTEGCCHNGKVIAPPDSHNGWVVLPYDFDQAGLIYTRYSAPSEKLPIKSVRKRLYRGFCSGNDQLDATVAMFNDNRDAIEDLFRDRDGSSENKKALKYLQGFYEIVNEPKKRQKKMADACQGRRKD